MPAQRQHGRRAISAGPRAADAGAAAGVDGVFDSYGRYWLEMFRLPAEVRSGAVDAHFTIEGFEHIERGPRATATA